VVLIERSVRIGDHIRVDGMEGQVTDIKTRFTLLRDTNGRESIIPNDMLITQRVDNFSLSDAAVALQSVVLVAVENDAAQVQALLQEALGKVSDVLPEPAAQVFFSRFSADGLEMTLNFWVANQLHTRMAVLSRVNTAVWSALSKAGIKLPPSKAIANLSTSTGDESR
jgi:small-conductance mechanosensitive channel